MADVVSTSPLGKVAFSADDPPIIAITGGHAFQWTSRARARAFLQAALVKLDEAER